MHGDYPELYAFIPCTTLSNVRKQQLLSLRYNPDWIVARLGVMEFLASGHGDTALQNDMTFLRGIQHIDAGPRNPASFVFCDKLVEA